MNKGTLYLNDTSKPTNERPDKFLAVAGERSTGSKLLAGLKIGSYSETQYRAPDKTHNYIDVMPNMGIDNTYSTFYHSDNSENERFTCFSEAAKKYNEVILAKDPELAQQYLIHNIPSKSPELTDTYIQGVGYRANPESCTILNSQESIEYSEKNIVLLYKDGKFAIVDNVNKNKSGLDLHSIDRPNFNIEDIQEVLNQYADKSKCEVEYGIENPDKNEDFTNSLKDLVNTNIPAPNNETVDKQKDISEKNLS